MSNTKVFIGAIVFIFVMIFFSVYINRARMEQENSISLEDRIAGKYCSNLKHETKENWDECYKDVLNNVTKRFETLHSCSQQVLNSSTVWTKDDWAKCYKDTSEALELINNM